MNVLPSTVYHPPPRLGRGRQLNTIIEEHEEVSQQAGRSDSEGDGSDSTIKANPAASNVKPSTAVPRKSSLATTTFASSPSSSRDSSPVSSSNADDGDKSQDRRSSCCGSDAGTVFSDDSCPSLSSDPTTFATDSSRNSVASSRASKNRYPALLIPRTSWSSVDSPIKEVALGMSPATKIRLSPSALSAFSKSVPAVNAPPSLGDSNSVASDSPCVTNTSSSGPVTPEIRQLEVVDGENWEGAQAVSLDQPLEIAIDEDHSLVLSPAEAHSATHSALLSPRDWSDIVVKFPLVPGGTPQDSSPLMPKLDEVRTFEDNNPPSDVGVRLPPDALKTLERLTRQRSADDKSDSSGASSRRARRMRNGEEMRERSEPSPGSRPRSADGVTPLSDYSFTQLSIPSPGGFFSSLQHGARHTWCLSSSKTLSVPSTAFAEKFYDRPWEKTDDAVETVVTIDDTNLTEGPPTARQAAFNLAPGAKGRGSREHKAEEDHDLYGPGDDPIKIPEAVKVGYEYEEKYEEELKNAAGANLDRTGSWLAAQTSYLSTLLDCTRAVDPNDFCALEDPIVTEDDSKAGSSSRQESRASGTLHSRDEARQPEATGIVDLSVKDSPASEPETKEAVFLAAYEHLLTNRKRRDAFLYASSRLEAIRSARVALPTQHISSLQGHYVMVDPTRPKYSGPFSQNPRATGVFERTGEQLAFDTVQREQVAVSSIAASNWEIEALRTIYHGRLLASPRACRRLSLRATVPLNDPACTGSKRVRILDIGGLSSASWAWHAAHEWPNVKVYTVVSKEQSRAQRPAGEVKPAGPPNHRTISVPHLWQLPFRGAHFDVISARNLHVLLKNNPVPGVPEIDEWDLVLRECMRVLRPGGYLDYMIMDSTIAHAGPRGEALSVEFGFELHRRGYEREAARSWLRRLKKEGFVGVKRAWMFLPMGRKPDPKEAEEYVSGYTGGWQSWRQGVKTFLPAPRPPSEVSTISRIIRQYMDVEAVQGPVGSTQDVADITGLLGARMWEEWLVKLRAESGREQSRWLEGIDEVIEEGKEKGSGWKILVGWARKPKVDKTKKSQKAEITVVMDGEEFLTPIDDGVETGMIPMVIQG